jgi:hypothetical protein
MKGEKQEGVNLIYKIWTTNFAKIFVIMTRSYL